MAPEKTPSEMENRHANGNADRPSSQPPRTDEEGRADEREIGEEEDEERQRMDEGKKEDEERQRLDEGRKEEEETSGKEEDSDTEQTARDEGRGGAGQTPSSDEADHPKSFSPVLLSSISPVKELDMALGERREAERRAFDELIKENVRLQRLKDKAEERYDQMRAKYEVRTIELEAERAKTAALEAKIGEMKKEMTLLIKAAKRAGVLGKGQRKDEERGDGSAEPDREACKTRANSLGADQLVRRQKLQELERRLLLLTEEDERKSRRLIALERQLLDKTRYIEILEDHVPADVKQRLAERPGASSDHEVVFTSVGKASNVVFAGRPEPYSYKNNIVQDSAVCVVS